MGLRHCARLVNSRLDCLQPLPRAGDQDIFSRLRKSLSDLDGAFFRRNWIALTAVLAGRHRFAGGDQGDTVADSDITGKARFLVGH